MAKPTPPVEVYINGTLQSFGDLIDMINSEDVEMVLEGIDSVPRELPKKEKNVMFAMLAELMKSPSVAIRAELARTFGFLRWAGSSDLISLLLNDPEACVRESAAKALMKMPNFSKSLAVALEESNCAGQESILKTLENDLLIQTRLVEELKQPVNADLRDRLVDLSPMLSNAIR